jgi:hypothetical protein
MKLLRDPYGDAHRGSAGCTIEFGSFPPDPERHRDPSRQALPRSPRPCPTLTEWRYRAAARVHPYEPIREVRP